MKNVILFLVALILSVLMYPIGIIYAFFDYLFESKFKKMFLSSALAIDLIGNTVCETLFNDILRTSKGYRFGDSRETISSVLGKNQRDNTLSAMGKFLANVLDFIDKDHCKRSIKDL